MISFQTMFGKHPADDSTVCTDSKLSNCRTLLMKHFDAIDLSALSDEELLERINLCAIQMLAADKLGMKPERRRWYDEEARALREKHRRPALVARLERERGLA